MTPTATSPGSSRATQERIDRFPPWLLWLAVAMVVVFVAFVVLLWQLGLFRVPKGGPDARIFAAVFGLLGALIATLMTFAAALLKHSIDTRTLELSNQTEGRLKLETSIRAVELLSTADGSQAPPTKQAGALFALAHLDQCDLALALLAQVWPLRDVSNEAAMWVIDRGLRDPQEANQIDAAGIYRDNGSQLAPSPKAGIVTPALMDDFLPKELPAYVRRLLMEAIIKAISTYSRDEWDDVIVNGFIVFLDETRRQSPPGQVQSAAIRALAIILEREDEDAVLWLDDESSFPLGPLKQQMNELGNTVDPGTFFSDSLGALERAWKV